MNAAVSQIFEVSDGGVDGGIGWDAAWNSSLTWEDTPSSFLDASLGGAKVGSGNSGSQNYSRSFKNSGLVSDFKTDAYQMSMHLFFATNGIQAGNFEVFDGTYGDSTAKLKLDTATSKWQASNGNSWEDIGIAGTFDTSYYVTFVVDPSAGTYSTTVSSIQTDGTVIQSASKSGLNFASSNAVNNSANGVLGFYAQSSSGGSAFLVDNINIDAVPEPSTVAFGMSALLFGLLRRRR
ncbi:hypothetical protein [Rubritalea sp.]|uniref:hypothetical protein n=1 Tax=Rubritalea sp. TaxID=2109375 RepID=UPI003F4ABCFF